MIKRGIDIRNNFVIECGDKKTTAFNNVTNAFKHIADGYAYAAYLMISDKAGHTIYKQTKMVAYNDDVYKGELYASYSVTLSGSEFPYIIRQMGFVPYPEASPANTCTVEIAPGNMTIYGTVYVDVDQADFSLTNDTNFFVRTLVGMVKLGEFRGYGRKASTGNYPMLISPSGYTALPVTASVTAAGINLTFDTKGYSDFYFTCGGAMCFRFGATVCDGDVVTSDTNFDNGYFILQDASKVHSVIDKNTGEPVPYEARQCMSVLYETGAYFSQKFEGYELFSDPAGRYAGMKNGSEFYALDERLIPEYKGCYDGELSLCSDGSAVCVKDGTVRFIYSGESVNVGEGQIVVLYRENGYDIYVYAYNMLSIYRYSEGNLELNSDYFVPEGGKLRRLNEIAVLIDCGETKDTFTVFGQNYYYFAVLDTMGVNASFIEDSVIYGREACSLIYKDSMPYDSYNGRLFTSEGKTYCITENGIKDLGELRFDSSAFAGNAMFVLCDGVLIAYRIFWDSIYVSSPYEKDVTCTYETFRKETDGTVVLMIKNKEEV